MLTIISPEKQAGVAGRRAVHFTGRVGSYVVLPSTNGISVFNVTFSPGARTFWRRHEIGQVRQVISGRGLIQLEDEPVCLIFAGDTVWIRAGARHWHGASPDATMMHTATSLGAILWEGRWPRMFTPAPHVVGSSDLV